MPAPVNSNAMSTVPWLIANSVAAVLLAGSVYYALAIIGAYWLVWTGGGVPSLLGSIGWGNTAVFFVWDTFRFCFLSFVAVWPVTFLKPQKPLLYSLLLVIAMILWYRYWTYLTYWATLSPSQYWVPWLILVHVLSIPAMYQLHMFLKSRLNRSLDSDASFSGAG